MFSLWIFPFETIDGSDRLTRNTAIFIRSRMMSLDRKHQMFCQIHCLLNIPELKEVFHVIHGDHDDDLRHNDYIEVSTEYTDKLP